MIEQTTVFWSERTRTEISPEDAREMVANVSGFFQVLGEWNECAVGIHDTPASHSRRNHRQKEPDHSTEGMAFSDTNQ